jgi:hypothetical protein
MDIWHFSLLFNLLVIHIMLPFSRSDLNIFSLGIGLLRRTQDHVTQAYLISAFGYVWIVLGGVLWRFRLGFGLRRLFSQLVEIPSKGSLLVLNSRLLLITHGALALGLIFSVLLYYFKVSGFGTNLGTFLLVNTELRPIVQFTTFYSVLVASYCVARYAEYRERSMLWIASLIALGLLFFGSRSAIFGILIPPALVLFVKMGRRLNLLALALGTFGALCLVFILDALRRPNFSPSAVAAGFAINMFYGNSFSDTRDFAIVLSFWDGHFFLGKTYLAGLLAFVPRYLSSFRDTWALGVVTATMAGFSPKEHAGLRIGDFGEAYLNFGLAAVMLVGAFVGACVRLVDLRVKQSIASLPKSGVRAYSYLVILSTVVMIAENSTVASAFYSVMLIFLVSWVALKVFRFLKLPGY